MQIFNISNTVIRLYNDSPVAATVVSNDRWGQDTLCKHGGFFTCKDRFNPGNNLNQCCFTNIITFFNILGTLQPRKWENALTIDKQSWGHRDNAGLDDFLTTKELIDGKNLFFIFQINHLLLVTNRNCGYCELRRQYFTERGPNKVRHNRGYFC